MILNVKMEKEGVLKDLDEIQKLAEKLQRKVTDMRWKITLEEPAEEESAADQK